MWLLVSPELLVPGAHRPASSLLWASSLWAKQSLSLCGDGKSQPQTSLELQPYLELLGSSAGNCASLEVKLFGIIREFPAA